MAGSTGIVPNKVNDKITWFENHIAPWNTNFAAIGTTVLAVSNLQTLTVAARDAFNAQKAAQDAAVGATNAMRMAVEAMATAGADIIKSVRTKAATAGDGVYTLAAIPVPANPTPVNTLGTASDFVVKLSVSGELDLSWKCANPRATGVLYQIWRRIGPTGEFSYLGGTGEKKFTDNSLPMGSSQVTYQIQAARSTAVGPWAQFNVNFGTTSGGAMTAMVSETAPTTKVAA